MRRTRELNRVDAFSAVQEALPDLRSTEDGAILITNGAFAETTAQMDEYAVSLKSMGIAGATVALVAATAALVVTPALLGLWGTRLARGPARVVPKTLGKPPLKGPP